MGYLIVVDVAPASLGCFPDGPLVANRPSHHSVKQFDNCVVVVVKRLVLAEHCPMRLGVSELFPPIDEWVIDAVLACPRVQAIDGTDTRELVDHMNSSCLD